MNSASPQESIAIVGMAGRFPQAQNLEEFWRNLRGGVEAVSFFNENEIQWLPVEHAPKPDDPRYVRARAVLEKPEWFDAAFFGMTPREAEIMDPQHRVFLECAWEALENAGCDPERFPGLIGVFAGASLNTYLLTNLLTHRDLVANHGFFSTLIANSGDFVPTRVSYKLNLRGPSINVQTACSTSLVAVCLAAQNLLSYRCDVALAGGVSITFPPRRGQYHLEGGIMSQDGHCRAFDAKASGTVLGDGAGVVVLKRLSDALADGDRVCAVIKGTAINNDGSVKIGYTAPSSDGQAEVIALAHAEAGFSPETVSYIEAHGTGTPLGDPIEIAGLAKAFGLGAERGQFCAVGSVKSNIGHLDIAAGVAGLIKTVLALQHGEIPPSLHFQAANPKLELERTPFFVNQALRKWERNGTPRRAGVSSFGIGGTNAHVAVEEPPPVAPTDIGRPPYLLALSAKTATALDTAAANLAGYLESNPEANLADVAFTLHLGRRSFGHRRAIVCDDVHGAVESLRGRSTGRVVGAVSEQAPAPIVFMLPGQGAQSVGMGRELYRHEKVFRAQVDRSSEVLKSKLGLDLREILFAEGTAAEAAERQLRETRLTQPAMFVVEHALAELWQSWGVRPQAMIGHSLGEYVAACLAGVFSLEDALVLVAERARLMQAQPAGAMLAIRANESDVRPFLSPNLALAAVNAPGLCVVSGPFDAIEAAEQRLAASAIASKRLATSHAFHSPMMEGVLEPFRALFRTIKLQAPKIPWVSNLTGTWITPEQATSPDYWSSHLRQTVRFAEGIATVMHDGPRLLLEVGPGTTLTGLARQHPSTRDGGARVIATLGRAGGNLDDRAAALLALGEVWTAGVPIAWREGFYREERRQIVSLPTYPFERKRYIIEPGNSFAPAGNTTALDGQAAMPAQNGADVHFAGTATPPVAAAPKATGTLGMLQEILHELSGVDLAQASPDATFYELGFDSLFLTQASVAIAKRFGVEITFRQLREDYRTLGALAARLDKLRAATTEPTLKASAGTPAPSQERPVEARLPLTNAQREMWFASQLGSAMSAAYNEASTLRLVGELDELALNRAIRALAARHEALRTRIAASGEEQIIASNGEIPLVVRQSAAPDASLNAIVEEETRREFDLVKGPLVRLTLIRREAREQILVLVAHHIVCDGWSLGVLLRELAELYSAEVERRAPRLAAAPSFREYVTKTAAPAEGPAFATAEKYWAEIFADEVPVLELPTDRPRAAERDYRGGFTVRTLSPDIVGVVKRLSTEHDCTPFTVLLAAFSIMMHRLSGQDDVVVGVPAAAQVMDGLENLVGHFANLLPVRSRVGSDETFGACVARIGRQMTSALEHWRYPFTRLLQQLNLARDSSRVPLAPVVFNTTRRRGRIDWAGLQAEVVSNPKPFVNFDLNFNFALTDEAITLGCYYSAELYDDATIARWFGHFETLLRGIGAAPDSSIFALPLLAEAERRQLLVEWNATELPYERSARIHDLFEEQVRRTPDAVAIVGEHERLTYAELNRRADRLAVRLRAAGVHADSLVGIFLKRSPQLLVAIFGVLKAGGAYVPLDPAYPRDRLEFIVQDTRMPVLVTERNLLSSLPTKHVETVVIDDERAVDEQRQNGHHHAVSPGAKSLAYIIYTSGSTGKPKGVCITHRCVVALVAWAQRQYRPDELAGVLFATSASFDISIFEIFCPLCLGGRIILAENILAVDRLPAKAEVTFLSGVPSALAEVVRLGLVPPNARTVALAGELFPSPLVEALYALPQIQRVFELYGPTETTVYSTGALRRKGSRPSLGRPFPNERVYILDRRLQPVPVGVPGEIFIGGDKVARGYLNRPDLTADKFLELPWLPGERVYRTGDGGRWLADGTIEFTSRLDHQVKIRGFRVEPGEIENLLAQHAAIAECVVLVRKDATGANRLLGYVVPRAGATVEVSALREHLRSRLPDYMVPAAITVLSKFPLTANGKLDRRALPEPEFAPTTPDAEPPRSTTEELLADIWQAVLGLDAVGINDNFFELGGHSLLATQVIARVQEALGIEMSMREFFVAPTIAGLAPVIERALIEQIKMDATESPGVGEALVAAKELT